MATITCECPRGIAGLRRVHTPACPNRKRGKGQQPKDYTSKARRPRSYQDARLAVEQLRDDIRRYDNKLFAAGLEGVREIFWPFCASLRLQAETIRRYLDGE